MKEVNPIYGDIEINESLENQDAMAVLPSQLFDIGQVITDDTAVELDRVAVGNPAQSVNNPDMQPLVDLQDIDKGSIDHAFLNPRSGDDAIVFSRADQQSAQ